MRDNQKLTAADIKKLLRYGKSGLNQQKEPDGEDVAKAGLDLLESVLRLTFAIVGIIAFAFTVSVLWGWFAVPVFGVPQLNISQAAGLILLLQTFTRNLKRSEQPEDLLELMAHIAVVNCATLAAGYVIKFFL